MTFDGIAAALVTRGDVDLGVILGSLPFDETVVWDNAERGDLQCYGRFAAAQETAAEWVYTQDDDLLAPIPALVRAWESAGRPPIMANRPAGESWRFLGCGAIYHRSLLDGLGRYATTYGADPDFHRVADVVFAYQTPYRSVDLGYLDFPWQTAENRMYRQPGHYDVRQRAIDRVAAEGWLIPES